MKPLNWVLLETPHWEHFHRLVGHELARWLSERGHRVAYLSAPVSPWHFLAGDRRDVVKKRWQQEGKWGQWRSGNLFTYIPRTLFPIHSKAPFDNSLAWKLSGKLCFPSVAKVLKRAGFDRIDVLCAHNLQAPALFETLNPAFSIYRMEDDISGFRDMPKVIVEREKEIISCVDLVTVTAQRLLKKAQDSGAKRTHYLPNGTRVARFARPEVLPPRPNDFPSGPVAIYVGALDWWFDEELMAAVAKSLPDVSFLLYGNARPRFDRLRAQKNVLFQGPIAPEEVPALLWHANVGIIPFRQAELIQSVFPLKLVEYMAAGLPTVATAWEEISALGSPAMLADSPEDFAAAINKAVYTTDEERKKYVDWAQQYDWEGTFEGLLDRVYMGMGKEGNG